MKKISLIFCFILSLLLLNSCSESTQIAPKGEDLGLTWELNEYTPGEQSRSKASFTLTNNSEQNFPEKGWTLYFSQMPSGIVKESLPNDFVVENIAGDFYKLYPTAEFKALKPGETKIFTWEKNGMINSVSDAPVGVYIVNVAIGQREGSFKVIKR